MKSDIHPDNYRTVLFYDSGADQGWLIRSCANTHGKTMVWKDGIEYPLFSLDTSSASHPVYTGKCFLFFFITGLRHFDKICGFRRPFL